MKHSAEFNAFTRLVDLAISVPREEILRREAEYQKTVKASPTKRGPKKKAVIKPPSPSRVPAS